MVEGEKTQTDVQDVLSKRASELWQNILAGKANWLYWLGLIPVFIVSWYVRTRNLPLLAGRYLVELDSYFFFRYAKAIYETGALPAIDMMRYVPLGFPTSSFEFFPKTMAYFYKIIHVFLPNVPQIQWHLFYPPVVTLVSFVFFFLFVKELFGHRTALISTAFLGVIPAYIQRTSAGFADHEAMAALWMFIGLWLFVKMWKAKDIKAAVAYGLLSGIFTGLLAMTWGGYRFMLMSVAAFFVAAILFKQIDKNKAVGYFCWGALLLVLLSGYYSKTLFSPSMLRAPDTGLIIFGFAATALYFYLPRIKHMSRQVAAVVVAAAIALLPAISFGVISVDAIRNTFAPAPVRWAATVSESQQPSFFGGGSWMDQYGWLMYFAILGAAILLYKIYEIKTGGSLTDRLKKNKYGIAAVLAYFVFIYIFTKGRSNTYLISIFAMFVLLAVLYFLAKRQNNLFGAEKYAFLLSFMAVFLTLILANVQIRLLFAFAPVAALAGGFFVNSILENLWKFGAGTEGSAAHGKTNNYAIGAKLSALFFCALVIFVFYTSAVKAEGNNRYVGSMVPGQWEAAMAFLREQTPRESVVTHWWDYGHMTAAVGERATVTDGGNVRSWNHASGRYFLTGKDRQSTLEYLKSHNVTHILISDQEIPKYHAFSLIGSDENFDRYSTIGVFALQDVKEARDGTAHLYGGNWGFDSNVIMGNLILPASQASISGFSYFVQNNTIQSPKLHVNYAGRQFQFDLLCIYKNGMRINFPTTQSAMKGCMVLVPYFENPTKGHETGAAFWASEKVWDTNFARLYLYSERDPNFRLVYGDQTPLAIYQGRVVGPIKIWEVNYPANIMPSEKYLEYSPYG